MILVASGEADLITDGSCTALEEERLRIIRLERSEEAAAALFQIVPIQILANSLAKNRGICPGKFRWSSKVTSSEYE